jgi:hypothetical protein
MGVAVIGGLLSSTILTLIVVPVFYTIGEWVSETSWKMWRKLSPGETEHDAHEPSGTKKPVHEHESAVIAGE